MTDVTHIGVSYIRGGRKRPILPSMITPNGVVRVTVTLDPIDIDLIDRLAAMEGSNRSAELRSMLKEVRPFLLQTVQAFERALWTRDEFSRAAAVAGLADLEELMPEVERLQEVMLGSLARLEGAAAARDPLSSNHGGHTPLTRGNANGSADRLGL